jgi:membrane protein
MKKKLRKFAYLYGARWFGSDGFGLAAAFSFYCLFAIVPMLAFVVSIASYFLTEEAARRGVIDWLQNYLADGAAADLVNRLSIDQWDNLAWVTTGLTGAFFLWGASLAFVRLRIAVNILLGVEAKSIRHAIRNSVSGRLWSILFTIVMGLVTALFVVLAAGATSFAQWVAVTFEVDLVRVVRLLSFLFFAVGLLAIIRVLPDGNRPTWRASFIAAGGILLTFQLGRAVLNEQLAQSDFVSAYGAANTLVLFLLWIFYLAQVLMLGINLCGPLDACFFRPSPEEPKDGNTATPDER